MLEAKIAPLGYDRIESDVPWDSDVYLEIAHLVWRGQLTSVPAP